MPFYRRPEAYIRKEAASQAIEKTIQEVEQALRIVIRRGQTPDESRKNMIAILENCFDEGKYEYSLDEDEYEEWWNRFYK